MRRFSLTLCGVLAVGSLACGSDPEPQASAAKKPAAKAAAAKPAAGKGAKGAADTEETEAPPAAVGPPIDFNDSAGMRDPFLSFAREFAEEAKKRVRSQRDVVLDQYALDELKLAGLVTGIRPARAMLIDPTKKGHVIHEGQFVGRAEVVQGGASGADYEINWRVDRIRDADIVLVREDPSNPDVPSATRVIPLRPDEVLAAVQ
ncbi:MAG TPA: pilus assembly protein PilP [Polyangiaceae bacterium]|nr:pilus assembly protein PilP [Polyangiaceae bacterium]